jgi:hypothetical protein
VLIKASLYKRVFTLALKAGTLLACKTFGDGKQFQTDDARNYKEPLANLVLMPQSTRRTSLTSPVCTRSFSICTRIICRCIYKHSIEWRPQCSLSSDRLHCRHRGMVFSRRLQLNADKTYVIWLVRDQTSRKSRTSTSHFLSVRKQFIQFQSSLPRSTVRF